MKKIKDSDLKVILAEVEAELGQLLKAEGQKLSKAKEDEMPAPDASKESTEASASPAPEASASPAPEASASPAPEMSAAPEAPAAQEQAPGEAVPGDVGSEAAPHDEAGEIEASADPEALKGEYMKLSPDELKNHFEACKAALFELMGGGEEQAPAAPMAPPAAPMAAPAPEMGKGEMKSHAEASGGQVSHKVEKSEDEVKAEELKKSESESKIKDLEQQVELLVKAVELQFNKPQRKAITSVGFVPKTDEKADVAKLTKPEVMDKLKTITASASLKKSERQLINAYCVGEVGLDKIEHLLTK